MEGLTLSTILTAASTAVTGVLQYSASQANASIMEMNAQISEDNAVRAIQRAQVEQEAQDQQTRAFLGEQLAVQSSSGVNIGSGSPVLTRVAARELGRMDALNIRQAGELESYNYKVDAASGRAQAQVERTNAAMGLLGSFLSAGSAITKAPRTQRSVFGPTPSSRPASLLI